MHCMECKGNTEIEMCLFDIKDISSKLISAAKYDDCSVRLPDEVVEPVLENLEYNSICVLKNQLKFDN